MRPRVLLDHVLVAVADLAEGARRFEDRYGLRALEGGRHPGIGTANMIVPLGSSYLELIAVVDPDEAARTPTRGRITQTLADGRTFATWAVRTDDLDALRGHLHEAGMQLPESTPGARRRPDGVVLRWRTQFLGPAGESSVLPFVIEWSVALGMHPAETPVQHPSGARGIRMVRLEDPDPTGASRRIQSLLGDDIRFAVEESASCGVLAVEVETPTGITVIR